MRLREIKQYGNSFFIALKPIDMQDLDLKVGDEVDIDDITINNLVKQETKGGKALSGK